MGRQSIEVDRESEMSKRLTLVQNGLSSKVEFRMWYYGETEEQAIQALDKIQKYNSYETQSNMNNEETEVQCAVSKYLNLQERIYAGKGEYSIPQTEPVQDIDISEWIGFNYVKSYKKQADKIGVNFFLDDYQFERVWNEPGRYTEFLKAFGAVLSPDFSLYMDFPKAIQIYNHYRKHWCAAYWQERGLTVIPTIAWSDKDSFEWCFDGEPQDGIVAVSNVGCMRSKATRQAFMEGYNEMLARLQPSKILMFAQKMDDYKGNVEQIKYELFRGKQG